MQNSRCLHSWASWFVSSPGGHRGEEQEPAQGGLCSSSVFKLLNQLKVVKSIQRLIFLTAVSRDNTTRVRCRRILHLRESPSAWPQEQFSCFFSIRRKWAPACFLNSAVASRRCGSMEDRPVKAGPFPTQEKTTRRSRSFAVGSWLTILAQPFLLSQHHYCWWSTLQNPTHPHRGFWKSGNMAQNSRLFAVDLAHVSQKILLRKSLQEKGLFILLMLGELI